MCHRRRLEIAVPGGSSRVVQLSHPGPHLARLAVTPGPASDLLVASRKFPVPSQFQDAEKRKKVTEVSISVAFPLAASDGSAAPAPGLLAFAFLPIRSYGLGFVLQSDFILASSRQDVLEDRPWNM